MIKIPTIDTSIKVINQVLQPYFNQIAMEVAPLVGIHRHKRLQTYRRYIEEEARSTKNTTLRMQLRINLSALLERFNYNGPKTEVNVSPKHNYRQVLETLSDEEPILDQIISEI